MPLRVPALLVALLLSAARCAGAEELDAAAAAISAGDERYARRAEGAQGGTALPGPVDAAISAYRRALAANPDSAAARWRLLRALFFRASFCAAPQEERRRILEEARRIGEAGVRGLEKKIGEVRGARRIEALRSLPDVAPLHFWTAVAWGEWALARGKFAAARAGAGGRIRDLARTAIDLDPVLEQGGGHRILGRLHDQAPRIPFLTFWVSRETALASLRRALELGPENTVNRLFLAEAILSHAPEQKAEARRLLEQLSRATPRPAFLVEDAHYIALARQRLAELG